MIDHSGGSAREDSRFVPSIGLRNVYVYVYLYLYTYIYLFPIYYFIINQSFIFYFVFFEKNVYRLPKNTAAKMYNQINYKFSVSYLYPLVSDLIFFYSFSI